MKSAKPKSEKSKATATPKSEASPNIRLLEEIELLNESKARTNHLSISISDRVKSLVGEQAKDFLNGLNTDQTMVVLQALSEANNLNGIMLLLNVAKDIPDSFIRAFKSADSMVGLFYLFVEHTYCIRRDDRQYDKLGELVLAVRESYPNALSFSFGVKAVQRAAELGIKLSIDTSTKILESDEFSLIAKMQALSTFKDSRNGHYDPELKNLKQQY